MFYLSLDNFKNKEIYNISDDKLSQNEVVNYGVKLLKLSNQIINLRTESEMLRNFYRDPKKVDNKNEILF